MGFVTNIFVIINMLVKYKMVFIKIECAYEYKDCSQMAHGTSSHVI